jgi:hypothetical protein
MTGSPSDPTRFSGVADVVLGRIYNDHAGLELRAGGSLTEPSIGRVAVV